MRTFNEFRDKVYENALIKFGHLTDEVKQRLDIELATIEEYDCTAILVCIWMLFDEMPKNNICSQLRIYSEYGVSLVCYVLGVSLFNPLEHPILDTESPALDAFSYGARCEFSIDSTAFQLIEQWLKEWGYEVEIEGFGHILSMDMWHRNKKDERIRIDVRYSPGACKLRRAIRELGDRLFYNIPFDDECVFGTIYNLDLYGTTTACFSPITLDALRLLKPTSLNELATALSFTKEEQYGDLMKCISARDKNRDNHFVQYVEAYNLYKLAYIKTHYPEYFNKILTYK